VVIEVESTVVVETTVVVESTDVVESTVVVESGETLNLLERKRFVVVRVEPGE